MLGESREDPLNQKKVTFILPLATRRVREKLPPRGVDVRNKLCGRRRVRSKQQTAGQQ